jgi:phospholipase/carboxylesterase
MKRFLSSYSLLAVLGILWLAAPVAGQPASNEVQFQNHRCLVAGPENLPDDASVVFILHGLGANADDLFPLIEAMNLPPCRYVLPDAPLTVGDHAYAWYDFQTQSRADMVKSRDYLFELIRHFSSEEENPGSSPEVLAKGEVLAQGDHFHPVILMGFSQGGVMSMEAGLNYKGRVEAIVSMSGYIWYPSQTLAHPLASKQIPILMVHGTHDGIVPEDWTQKTVKALRKAGYKPVFKEFPMAHQITRDSIAVVAEFLKKVMAKN